MKYFMVRFTGIAEVELESRTFKPDFFFRFLLSAA